MSRGRKLAKLSFVFVVVVNATADGPTTSMTRSRAASESAMAPTDSVSALGIVLTRPAVVPTDSVSALGIVSTKPAVVPTDSVAAVVSESTRSVTVAVRPVDSVAVRKP